MTKPTPVVSLCALMLASLSLTACPNVASFECGPSNCNGCCMSDGTCTAGTLATACGKSGNLCDSCVGDQTCTNQVCGVASSDGGTGGGTNGGNDGGTCVPESNAVFCSRAGKNCGSTSGTDNCGLPRAISSCGTCTAPQTCASGACGCVPETNAQFCARQSLSCGSSTGLDNCGSSRTVSSCGTCSGSVCTMGECVCATETNAQFCNRIGARCGAISGLDLCGNTRNVASCGNCSSPSTCGGEGVPNSCGCTPETEAQLCEALGRSCGTSTTTDRCRGSRTVNCGTCSGTALCAEVSGGNACVANPGTWAIRHERNQPTLNLVYAAAANDVWGAAGTTLYRFQGTRWNRFGTIAIGARAFWSTAPNNVWVVGYGPVGIMHFDGTAWSNATGLPDLGPTVSLNAIWGRSATEIYAVGAGLILRYDGTTWVQESINPPRSSELFAVLGVGSATWVMGNDGTMLTRVGTQWLQDQAAGNTVTSGAMMTQAYFTPSGEARAVDYRYATIYKSDGGVWSEVRNTSGYLRRVLEVDDSWYIGTGGFSNTTFALYKNNVSQIFGEFSHLHGVAANDAWAVGTTIGGRGIIYHLDAGTWSSFVDSPTLGDISAISGVASNDIWAGGFATVLHYDGTSWSQADTKSIDGLFACGPNEAWGTRGGNALHFVNGQVTTSIAIPSAPTHSSFSGVWGVSCTDFWLAGGVDPTYSSPQALLYHYANGTFTRTTVFAFPTTATLKQLWGFAANDIWVTTSSSKLIHYDGMLWSEIATASPPASGMLWGAAANDLWDVSCNDYSCDFWHWNGTAWTDSRLRDDQRFCLAGVFGKSATDAWAVGGCGQTFGGPTKLKLIHFDGTQWARLPSLDVPDRPIALWGSSGGYWITGEAGLVLERTGTSSR